MDVKDNLKNIESEIQTHFENSEASSLPNVIAVTKYVQ